MRMLDLFSGLGGASQAMRERHGWEVTTVDNNPAFGPSIVADIRDYIYKGPHLDLIWASPPCTEFSRKGLPWKASSNQTLNPDLSLVLAALQVIHMAEPTYWVIENVKGAIPYLRSLLGTPVAAYGPVFLWGHFPDLGRLPRGISNKEGFSGRQPAQRAAIPYRISRALAEAVERHQVYAELGRRTEGPRGEQT